MVSFVVLPDRVFLACARRGRLDFGVSPLTRLQARERVKAWHDAVRRSDDSTAVREADAALADLAGALQLGPLLDRLPRRVHALTIVPDDSLHGLPFAVLRHRGELLIERFALTLGLAREPGRPAAARTAARGAVLVGVSRGMGSIPPLPGVSRELDTVQARLGRRAEIDRLEDDRADRATVLSCLAARRVAHLACHGIFRPDRPDASGLVLIPAPGRVELLSLRDLSETYLANLGHATLSACWSADGFILPGRRVISLPETLCRSGVGSVLGSLWPVDDATASALMDRFYAHLARRPADEALRLAQLDMIRGTSGSPDPFAAHAIAWAGFTLTGHPGRVSAR
jgi:CHAT domain-containing protein